MNRFNTLLAAGLLILAGCSEDTYERPHIDGEPSSTVADNVKPVDEIDFGTIDNSTYINKYFGLSLKIPADWIVQDEEAKKQIADMGSQMVASADPNLSRAIEAAKSQTVNLLFVSQHPIGAPVKFNPNFIAIAERLRNMPGVKRGKDYLFHLQRTLKMGKMPYSFAPEVTTENIGGRDFDVLSGEMPIMGNSVHQKFYTTVMKGYVLLLTLSYCNDEEKAALDKILDTIKFD